MECASGKQPPTENKPIRGANRLRRFSQLSLHFTASPPNSESFRDSQAQHMRKPCSNNYIFTANESFLNQHNDLQFTICFA
jgi:hypothetical protein